MKNKFIKIYLPLLLAGSATAYVIVQRTRRDSLIKKLQDKLNNTVKGIQTETETNKQILEGSLEALKLDFFTKDPYYNKIARSKDLNPYMKLINEAKKTATEIDKAIGNWVSDESKLKAIIGNLKSQSQVSFIAKQYKALTGKFLQDRIKSIDLTPFEHDADDVFKIILGLPKFM